MALLRALKTLVVALACLTGIIWPVLVSAAAPAPCPIVTDVLVVSSINTSEPNDANKIVEFHDTVTIWALLKCSSEYYLGGASGEFPTTIELSGKSLSVEDGTLKRWPSERIPPPKTRWYSICPVMKPSVPLGNYEWYSNVFDEGDGREGSWRGWQTLEYEQCQIDAGSWSYQLQPAAGTYRFRIELESNGSIVSSAGTPDPTEPSGISPSDYDKGIAEHVHRITRLSNHPARLVQYVEALRFIPWLWGADYRDPPENTPRLHQSDLYNPVGIECSSMLTSALRAMGNEELSYTTAKHFSLGRYCEPASAEKLTLERIDLFKEYSPTGIAWAHGKVLLYGGNSLEVRGESFAATEKTYTLPGRIIDTSTTEDGTIYVLLDTEYRRIVALLNANGEYTRLFAPTITQTVSVGATRYTIPVEINPTGIAVAGSETETGDSALLYLFYEQNVLVFDVNGTNLASIKLENCGPDWTPLGQLSLNRAKFWIPHQNGRIDTFQMSGQRASTIDLGEEILGVDVRADRLIALHPFPLTILEYSTGGKMLWDYQYVFKNEQGQRRVLPVGPGKSELHLADLLVTVDPSSYHVLLLFQDNGNARLDARDKVVCAGHEGIEIRKVSYFEDKWFVIRRLRQDLLQ